MTRPRKLVPALQHHKATGQAKVRLADGTIRYLGKWNSKAARQSYVRLVAELTATGNAPLTGRAARQADGPSVSAVVLAWLEYAKRHYQKNGKATGTLYAYRAPLRALRELYGDISAGDFGPVKLETVRARLAEPITDEDTGKTSRRSRTVVNRYARQIVGVFRWAASRELIPASVPQALAMLSPIRGGRTDLAENEPVGPVEDATVDATLPHLSRVIADMVVLQRATGMRPGEVCQLHPCDLDRSGDVWTFEPQSHKLQHHGRRRIILIGPRGQAVLLPYLLRPSDAFCFSPAESVRQRREARSEKRRTPEGYGNGPGKNGKRKPAREPGERFDVASYRRAVNRAATLAGVDPWSPNQLRHSFATEARIAGGLEAVQGLLGHSNLETSQVYAERQNGLAREIAAKIG